MARILVWLKITTYRHFRSSSIQCHQRALQVIRVLRSIKHAVQAGRRR
jgi:hypothetical protein